MGRFKDDGDIELTFYSKPEALRAFAQLLKRIDYDAIKKFTVGENELELAKEGIADVWYALEEAKLAPR